MTRDVGPRLRVEPHDSIVGRQTTGIGATPVVAARSSEVSLVNPQPTLSLGSGNYSSCPKAASQLLEREQRCPPYA
jgi:hypothetical protein